MGLTPRCSPPVCARACRARAEVGLALQSLQQQCTGHDRIAVFASRDANASAVGQDAIRAILVSGDPPIERIGSDVTVTRALGGYVGM